jgi:hypothetical protein
MFSVVDPDPELFAGSGKYHSGSGMNLNKKTCLIKFTILQNEIPLKAYITHSYVYNLK